MIVVVSSGARIKVVVVVCDGEIIHLGRCLAVSSYSSKS